MVMDTCTNCKKPLNPEEDIIMSFASLGLAFCDECRMDKHVTRILAGQADPPLDLWG